MPRDLQNHIIKKNKMFEKNAKNESILQKKIQLLRSEKISTEDFNNWLKNIKVIELDPFLSWFMDIKLKLFEAGILQKLTITKSTNSKNVPMRDPFYSPHVGGSQEFFGTHNIITFHVTISGKPKTVEEFKSQKIILEMIKANFSSKKPQKSKFMGDNKTSDLTIKLFDPIYKDWKNL